MTRTDISFESAGIQIAGHLYLPEDTRLRNGAAIVVGHPGSGVKEQAAGLYARLLSEQGFVALSFDAAFQGESGGVPRGLEDPAQRVEDFKAAVSFLSTRNDVDSARIGMLGICASGGYTLSAMAGDSRVKALATVSAVDISRQFRLGADGSQDPAVFRMMLATASEDRTAATHSGRPGSFALFPDSIEQARALAGDHGAEGFEYYRTPRADHPRAGRFMPWSSIDKMASFDAFAPVPMIGQRPLLMVVGTRAVTSWMSVEAFQKAVGPKEMLWMEGASHVDLYDKQEYLEPIIIKMTDFFSNGLG